MIARAYHNYGRWVADCPRPFCANARRLEPGQERFWCGPEEKGCCRLDCPIEWPPDAEDIDRVLKRRPVPATRNWFPSGHDLAVRAGIEHGQTVADLLAENQLFGVK
ncbi:hypothetical protein [Actinomadura meridiana]|uniref:hypothetical protein n=1 Tax=Actinomadura meridiana TaxID=559626 RepID=UPI0031EDF7BC